ncbi:phospholipase A-2-activating protein [Dioscorea cayenensis subsp. rotundata]|uniref:Phospholipase A-2-activating protein n=1 Tax=Dioscorea cayennensis subsp. rotundata TaxID=55577 RepID=A0AB40BUC1_DIOCR|nr:phospholipase A-2-activating protein [Dioscorea cayenensis subsp. rotundata]
MASQAYRLSSELRGHEDDVRGICVCGGAGIATSSRDRTVRFWAPDPEKKQRYSLSKTFVGHSSFVGPLAWIPPGERFPEGGIVSGGMDALVLLWDLRTMEAVETMRGHQMQVTGVAVDAVGDIISSSVDCSIRRWRKGHMVDTWEAHKLPIQTVVTLPSGEIITGSSDASIKLWKGKTCQHTFLGHTDTVRGLTLMPGLGILSASHDCSIRLWALTGQLLMEMVGHTSLVYSVDAHISGLVASGSEDCSLKIWKDGLCIQSIEHPGCVWDAKFLENGDIVTACSDGVIRIWTLHADLVAESNALESYEIELSQYKSSRKKVGGLKLADLPGLEGLQIPGTSDGQTKVIREGDNGVAYSWNSRDHQWEKIGEVVDGPGDNTGNRVFDGVQYDYVFDVDIGDGEPTRKLPYNKGDNPYTAADKWLLKENLPLSYRQQVVEFILQNSGQSNFSLDTSFRDPYTGSSAYVPGQPSMSVGSAAKPTFKHVPKKGMLFFDSAQFDGILKKIGEFNTNLLSDMENKSLSLTEIELSRLSAIAKVLKDTSHYHCSTFAAADIDLLSKILRSWPIAMMFPVIDVLRIFIMHPDGASLLHKRIESGDDVLLELFKRGMTSPIQAGNLLTIIRATTNLFKHSCFSQWLQRHCSEILDALSGCRSSFNKNANLSYSTLIVNYAVLLINQKDQEGQAQILSAALEIAEDENQDTDSRFRALVAIGSLMLDGLVKSIAIDFDVQSIAKSAKTSKDTRIAEVAADIDLIIKAT